MSGGSASQQSHGSRVLSGDWPFTFHVPVKILKKQKAKLLHSGGLKCAGQNQTYTA